MANAKSLLIEQIEQLAVPVLQEHAAELVDVQFIHEYGQWVLRFFVDKEKGVTLDDCAEISEHLSRILDATDLIKQRYSLEVSSPGINRTLKKEADFQRFIGERVDITLFAPMNGRRHFKGMLKSAGAGAVIVEEAQPLQAYTIPLADVAKARLDPDVHF